MKHVYSTERPICALESRVDRIGDATRAIYRGIDCPDCLRRAIAEADERSRVLRDLLAKTEVAS